MVFPKDFRIDAKLLVEFHQVKKADLAKIDLFMNEFNDWHMEKIQEAEEKFKGAEGAVRPLMAKRLVEEKLGE